MSKRIPVYLSEGDLRRILSWFEFLDNQSADLTVSADRKLEERLQAELDTFEESSYGHRY